MGMQIFLGDCLEVLKTLPDNSVDSVVTDPPAGIGFMGKDWDHHKGGRDQWIAWLASILKECNRVLKPGGYALVWSIPRTSHWTGMACEDAGFEVRDQISHIFGSGFPKSHNLKGEHTGWGSALKPSREDWWLCRKPLSEKTLAQNVVKWGCGGINIDGSRISTNGEVVWKIGESKPIENSIYHFDKPGAGSDSMMKNKGNREGTSLGRWPSHTIFDEDAAEQLDEMSGDLGKSKSGSRRKSGSHEWQNNKSEKGDCGFGDTGGASRFFYVAKASKSERNRGCEGLPVRQSIGGGGLTNCGDKFGSIKASATNHHPTVKPIKLMEYLIKLITPPNGTVLDPFMGSGSTGVAAKNLGMKFIGIEQNEDYFEIAKRRISL